MSELGQKIIAEVRKAAEDRPEYVCPKVFDQCEYIRDGGPSCIVGHALWNVGLINPSWEGDDWGDSSIKNVIAIEGWPLTIGEINWLSRVQESQDDGYPWGRSVARADHPAFRALNEIDEDV